MGSPLDIGNLIRKGEGIMSKRVTVWTLLWLAAAITLTLLPSTAEAQRRGGRGGRRGGAWDGGYYGGYYSSPYRGYYYSDRYGAPEYSEEYTYPDNAYRSYYPPEYAAPASGRARIVVRVPM